MIQRSEKPSSPRLRQSWLSRFRDDRSGVSAIEFTLIFPILVALFAGTVDLGQSLMVSRKMNQIVASTADVISQNPGWTTADATALLKGMSTIIQPYDVNDLTIKLTVLDVDSKLDAKVKWSLALHGDKYAAGVPSPVVLPTDMATANVQMILVESDFGFSTPFSGLLSSVTGMDRYNYNRHYFMRPRNSDTVTLN